MSLKLRHHLGVPGSLDGVRIPNCAVERKYLWIRLRGQVGPADLLSRVLSRKRLRCPRCCAHLASFPVHHYNHQQLDTANHLLQSPVFVSSCKDSHLCMHTHKRKPPRWYTQQGISGFWKKAQAVGCSYCEPGVLHLYLPATANLYSLTVGCTSFLWGELLLWCVVVAVVLRGIFQDCYSVSQWLWAVYFGGSGRKFNHSSVMSFQNQRSTHSALSSTECSYRHALCSRPFDSTAITRCICSCPVAESNSCQSTSRRARASAHKTVHLPVISRGWVRFHSQPSVNQTAASLRRTAWKMRRDATFRLSDLSFLYHDFNLKEPRFPTSIIKYNLASFCKRFSSPGKLSLGSAALRYATYNPRRTLQHLYNHSCIKIHKESQCSHIQI